MTLAIADLAQLAGVADSPAKAVSGILFGSAGSSDPTTGEQLRPWPWSNTAPIARLQLFKYDVDLIVLEGLTDDTLAFGPGHMTASALPGNPGNCIIGAHNDRHFEFLDKLTNGDRIFVERYDGREFWFRVSTVEVACHRNFRLQSNAQDSTLSLVSRYPVDSINSSGPKRHIVTANKLPLTHRATAHSP